VGKAAEKMSGASIVSVACDDVLVRRYKKIIVQINGIKKSNINVAVSIELPPSTSLSFL